jgi:hypothetical protein
MTVLTLSLSIQVVSAKQENEALNAQNEKLTQRVQLLENRLKELGVAVLTDEEEKKLKEEKFMQKLDLELQEKSKYAPKSKGVMV